MTLLAKDKLLPQIQKQFGSVTLTFDVAKMTPKMMDRVKVVIGEILSEDSLYVRVPAGVNQAHSDYFEEAQTSDPKLMRRPDESPEEHAARILAPNMRTADLAFKILNGLAPLFSQELIIRDEFDNVPIHDIRTFVYNVLNFCDCPTGDQFFPKRIADGRQFR